MWATGLTYPWKEGSDDDREILLIFLSTPTESNVSEAVSRWSFSPTVFLSSTIAPDLDQRRLFITPASVVAAMQAVNVCVLTTIIEFYRAPLTGNVIYRSIFSIICQLS